MGTVSTADSSKLARSASAIVSSTEKGQHLLKIDGYSRIKDAITTGSYICNPTFYIGSQGWYFRYYPNGGNSGCSDCISVRLVNCQNVRAQFTLSLLDQDGEPVPSYTYHFGVQNFTSFNGEGPWRFIQKAVLERSAHLRDNCFTIKCDITIIKSPESVLIPTGSPTPPPPPVVSVPPPSDLSRHLGGLLPSGEGADVTFEVDGKTFLAHKNVLGARSPVFRAELFSGPKVKEYAAAAAASGANFIIHVDDMEAQDFEALLHFIYTDSLPEVKAGEAVAMLPDLVAAANRYKMERLRLVCEQKLYEYVNGRTVVAMLAFADEHHCNGLKEKCLRFLDDPVKLREIVKAEGLENLSKNYSCILMDLIAKLTAAAPA